MIPVKTLIDHCKKMPHATQDIKWDIDLVFSIGGKMFAIFDNERYLQFSFKASTSEFNRLTKLPGVMAAPYLAQHHWVAIKKDAKLPTTLLKNLLEESYALVMEKLPKKVQDSLKPPRKASPKRKADPAARKQAAQKPAAKRGR